MASTFPPPPPQFASQPRRAFLFGESSMQNNIGLTGGVGWSSTGYVAWFNRIAGQPLQLSPSNFYCGTYNSKSLLEALQAQVLANAANFDIIFLSVINNDVPQGVAATTSVANAKSIVTQLLNAGKWVVFLPILPWNGASADALKQMLWINQQMREWARTVSFNYPFFLIDFWRDVADPTSATGQWVSPLSNGGGDPGAGGAYLIGKRIAAALGPFLSPPPDLAVAQADVYDATYNPHGNLLTNGSMATLSGGAIQSGAGTGTLVGGWGFNKISGSYAAADVVLSTAANAAGFNAPPGGTQTITVNIPAGNTANEQFEFLQWNGSIGCNVGDVIYAGAEVTLTGVANMWGAGVQIYSPGDSYGVGDGGASSAACPFYPGAYPPLILRPPPFTVTSAFKSNAYPMLFTFNFDASGATPATATITITGTFVRKLSP
jgi:hypothetical protein